MGLQSGSWAWIVWVVLAAEWLGCAWLCYVVATRKGYGDSWLLLGVLFGLFALIAAAGLPPAPAKVARRVVSSPEVRARFLWDITDRLEDRSQSVVDHSEINELRVIAAKLRRRGEVKQSEVWKLWSIADKLQERGGALVDASELADFRSLIGSLQTDDRRG